MDKEMLERLQYDVETSLLSLQFQIHELQNVNATKAEEWRKTLQTMNIHAITRRFGTGKD